MGYCFINELHEFLYILDKMLPLQMCFPVWYIFLTFIQEQMILILLKFIFLSFYDEYFLSPS